MPDNEGQKKKREFMRENIVKQPLSRREIMKRLVLYACFAAVFGAVAAVSFVLARPLADRYLGTEDPAESSAVQFTKDEPETRPAETPAEESLPEETLQELMDEEQFQKAVEKAVKEYTLSPEYLGTVSGILREIGQKADKGIVTVRSGKQQVDLFGNPVESTGDYAGAVIARTRGEYLIFTSADAARDASSLMVEFYDGSKAAGGVKQIDEVLDMAVVSVPAKDISEQVKSGTEVLALGNSYAVRTGDLVVGVGGPTGKVHSVTFGLVSYVARSVPVTDGLSRVFYTDMGSDSRVGTFLLNTSGEIIGWTSEAYTSEGTSARTTALGISDYKAILEKMSNGVPYAYFGIRGQELSESMSEESGVPRGVYVTDAVTGGPAYDVGIQNGDVIIQFAGTDIFTMKDLQTQIEKAPGGEPVTVKVMRKGRETYTELEYNVDIRAR